jgi:hypothetical protein
MTCEDIYVCLHKCNVCELKKICVEIWIDECNEYNIYAYVCVDCMKKLIKLILERE